MEVNDLFYLIRNTKTSDIVLQGGTDSGKTYAALQNILFWSIEMSDLISTVISIDIPCIKRSALRDAIRIINTNPEIKSQLSCYNKQKKLLPLKTIQLLSLKVSMKSLMFIQGKEIYCS